MAKAQTKDTGKSCKMRGCITDLATKLIGFAEQFKDVMPLIFRIYIADIFITSAILKLPAGFLGFGEGNWDTTLFLFEHEHPVPFLPAQVAAVIACFNEIFFSGLLVIGLGARVGALVLLFMTAVIEFTYQSSTEHIVWAMLLGYVLLAGPGKLSIDHFIRKKHMDA
jgi:putative oxidoreductase